MRRSSTAKEVALCGLMIAAAFIFSYVESMIPINLGVPGVKAGLANLVTIVSLFLLGAKRTAAITLIRVALVGFTFGSLSMMMYGMAGAVLSFTVMVLLRKTDILGIEGISISGGIAHNVGQLAVAAMVLESGRIFYYLPILLIAGAIAGLVIGIAGALMIVRLRPLIDKDRIS